jgi:hypothetical protein
VSVSGVENYSNSDDDCILLEDAVNEFPKPMNFQEMAGKSELGTLLDIKIDWQEQEIEVAEPIRTVSESCSEIQEIGSIEEAGTFGS